MAITQVMDNDCGLNQGGSSADGYTANVERTGVPGS